MIVVFDTSALVSATLKRGGVPDLALRRALNAPDKLIVSREVEEEYRDVVLRAKFDRFVALPARIVILNAVVSNAQRIEPAGQVRECADPDDDKFLSLAAAGNADVIVTGDLRHLIAMHPWRGIAILRPADYLALP